MQHRTDYIGIPFGEKLRQLLLENRRLLAEEVSVDRYDDDAVHIAEHTRFLLSDEFRRHEEAKERFTAHLRGHEEQARRRREETAR